VNQGPRWYSILRAVLAAAAWLALAPVQPARAALTPESPEVVEAVRRGMEFLEENAKKEGRAGAQSLVGLVWLKQGKRDDPILTRAVEAIRAQFLGEKVALGNETYYSAGLSVVFLVEYDSVAYAKEIRTILDLLLEGQKPHGGWGYPSEQVGDTSITQYCTLAMWIAARAGFDVPERAWEDMAGWWIRTQDPSGAFGYKGVDSGTLGKRSRQGAINPGLTAAGVASLYLCTDHLFGRRGSEDESRGIFFRAAENVRERPRSRAFEPSLFASARDMGNNWFTKNYQSDASKIRPPLQFAQYYLYTFERYQAFREMVDGQGTKTERNWYDDGARFLLKTQDDDGTWASHYAVGKVADTSFALLFLMRATRATIRQTLGAGTLVGGRGLPDGEVIQVGGAIKRKPRSGPAEELLAALDDPSDPRYEEALDRVAELSSDADELMLSARARQFRDLAVSGSTRARVAAIRALARTHDLDQVPLLIYAMVEGNTEVAVAAHDALRFLSRRFDGLGIAAGELGDRGSRRAAVDRWKAWYLEVRPDAVFEN